MWKKNKEENLNLVKILKNCPEDTKLYSPVYGEVELVKVHSGWDYPIEVKLSNNTIDNFTEDGRIFIEHDGECMLFPSKNQRDWSKFKPKKPKFDPKTLQPFDRVLVKTKYASWKCGLFSNINDEDSEYKYYCIGGDYVYCIPYNDDTKHLIGTTEEAPEFYRYWEE